MKQMDKRKLPDTTGDEWEEEDDCFCDLCEEVNSDALQNEEDWKNAQN